MGKSVKHGLAAVLLLCACASSVLAQSGGTVPRGSGQVVYGDVPVTPGSFPDNGVDAIGLAGKGRVKSQVFKFASGASTQNVAIWYAHSLPAHRWHVESIRANYPTRLGYSIIATRPGEAVTVIIQPRAEGGSRVSLIKVNSAR